MVVGVSGGKRDAVGVAVSAMTSAGAYAIWTFAWDQPRHVAGDELNSLFWGSIAVALVFAAGGLAVGLLTRGPQRAAILVGGSSVLFSLATSFSTGAGLGAVLTALCCVSGGCAAALGRVIRLARMSGSTS